jgi:hypothetical protein
MSSYFVYLLTSISSATLPSPAAACACLRSPPSLPPAAACAGRALGISPAPDAAPCACPSSPPAESPTPSACACELQEPPRRSAHLPHLLCPHRRMLIQNATGKKGKSGRPAARGRQPERERMWEMRMAARVQRRARPHDPERRRGSLPLRGSRLAKSCLAARRRPPGPLPPGGAEL